MSYRGQDFIWYERSGWSGSLPESVWAWITARTAPINSESIVLWARSDLFPDSQDQIENEQDTESSTDEIKLEDGSAD